MPRYSVWWKVVGKQILRSSSNAYQKGKPCFIPILHDVGDLRHLNSRVALERVEIRIESEELIVGSPITFWPQLKGHTPWADINS